MLIDILIEVLVWLCTGAEGSRWSWRRRAAVGLLALTVVVVGVSVLLLWTAPDRGVAGGAAGHGF